ncbi:OprD family porin [Pseudomonas sp. NPDC087346]|uniref:OprD family porin n=1 Tax=Pseudomonas sp. NPDC087346 TaxID=3364438 RepID=UPI0037FD7A7A
MINSNNKILSIAVASLASGSSQATFADFIEDSKANLELRNYYFNRDYREGAGQNKREEWAQGFLLNYSSGFTDGIVGLGLDAFGVLGVKLDSSPDRTGTGLLSQDRYAKKGDPSYARRAKDEYSKLGLTAKLRFEKSELRVGTLQPSLPLIRPNISRISPQLFEGAMITSKDFNNFTLNALQINKQKYRDSTDYQPLQLTSQSGAYTSATSDRYYVVGGDYSFTPQLLGTYYYSDLDNIMKQQFFGLKYGFPLGDGKVQAEARYFNAAESGGARAGKVDNQALSTRIAYIVGGHTFSGGLQKLTGDTPLAYLDGANSYLFSEIQSSNFSQTKERTMHLRYDYDFSSWGLPGLMVSTSYFRGDQARVNRLRGEQNEWERDSSLSYVFQTGPLKNLSIKWQNAHLESSFARDTDENRLYFAYTIPIF